MIEKYKSSWEYDCSSTPEAWTHNCYMLVNFVEGLKLKINELVDAVNELQTKVNKLAQNINFAQPEVKENVQKEPTTLLDIFNEMGEMYSSLWNKMEDIHHDLKTKGGDNE